jgi:hypothetical protein
MSAFRTSHGLTLGRYLTFPSHFHLDSAGFGELPAYRDHHVQFTAVVRSTFVMLCILDSAVVSKMAHDRSVGTSLPPAFSFFPVAHAGLNTYFSPCTTDKTSSTASPLWSIQVTLSSSHTSEHPQTLTTQRRAPQSSTPWPSPKQSGRSALFPHHHLTTGPSSYPTKLPTLCLLMISPPKLRPSSQSSRKRCGCKSSLL